MITGIPGAKEGFNRKHIKQEFQQFVKEIREQQPVIGERLGELMDSAKDKVDSNDFFMIAYGCVKLFGDLKGVRERLPVRLEYLLGWTDQREKETRARP